MGLQKIFVFFERRKRKEKEMPYVFRWARRKAKICGAFCPNDE